VSQIIFYLFLCIRAISVVIFLSKVKKFESDLAIFENSSIFVILGGEIVEMRSGFPDFWEKKRRKCDRNRRNSPGRCAF